MADALVQLNDSWRVADDPPQWVLEKRMRERQPGKASGWQARKYIRTTDHLLKRIGEICGSVDSEAIEIIRSWPRGYVTWKAREMKRGAGPEKAPYGAISPPEAPEKRKVRPSPPSGAPAQPRNHRRRHDQEARPRTTAILVEWMENLK